MIIHTLHYIPGLILFNFSRCISVNVSNWASNISKDLPNGNFLALITKCIHQCIAINFAHQKSIISIVKKLHSCRGTVNAAVCNLWIYWSQFVLSQYK